MKAVYKYLLLVIGFLLIAIMILNPSVKRFKEFCNQTESKNIETAYRKIKNYFIFSVFEKETGEMDEYGEVSNRRTSMYIGFMGNFWRKWNKY